MVTCVPHYRMFTYIYSLLIEKGIYDRQNIAIRFPCFHVFVCDFYLEISSFFGKSFFLFFSYKVGKERGNSLHKMKISLDERHTWKLYWYVSTITDVFLNLKKINVCEHTVKMVSWGMSKCSSELFVCLYVPFIWRSLNFFFVRVSSFFSYFWGN